MRNPTLERNNCPGIVPILLGNYGNFLMMIGPIVFAIDRGILRQI